MVEGREEGNQCVEPTSLRPLVVAVAAKQNKKLRTKVGSTKDTMEDKWFSRNEAFSRIAKLNWDTWWNWIELNWEPRRIRKGWRFTSSGGGVINVMVDGDLRPYDCRIYREKVVRHKEKERKTVRCLSSARWLLGLAWENKERKKKSIEREKESQSGHFAGIDLGFYEKMEAEMRIYSLWRLEFTSLQRICF